MKQIIIDIVPHAEQRYDTLGDYWFDGSAWHITVSDMHDWRFNYLVALHELIEMALVHERGISEPAICEFDKAMPDDSVYADDPGMDPAAPYHREHLFADAIERLTADQLGVDFVRYSETMCDKAEGKDGF